MAGLIDAISSPENISAAAKNGVGSTLSEIAINKATSFVQGAATTALTKITSGAMQNQVSGSAIKIAATVTGIVAKIKQVSNPNAVGGYIDNLENELIVLGSEILNKAVEKLTAMGTKQLVRIIGPFLNPASFAMKVAQQAGSRAIAYIYNEILDDTREDGRGYFMTKGELLESLLKTVEDIEKRNEEKKKKKKQSKFVKELIETANTVKKYADEYIPKVEEVISTTLTYIEDGPEYVKDFANKKTDKALAYVDKKTTYYADKIIEARDIFVDKTIDKVAYQLAIVMDKVRQKAVEMAHALLEKTKSKALIVAWSFIQKAVLKIMALTGISIPI